VIYPFPSAIAWLGIFISRENGLIPEAPWLLLALSGWIISRKKGLQEIIFWIGWPVILSGIIISAWLKTGTTPELTTMIVPVVCLIPFFGNLWPFESRTFTAAITRVLFLLSVSISLVFWVVQQVYQINGVTIGRILEILAAQSGIELYKLVPVISHQFPIVTHPVMHWIVIMLVSLILILLTKRMKQWKLDVGNADLLVCIIIIVLSTYAIRSSRVWFSIPLETEKVIKSGETWKVDLELSRFVNAIELESRLSRSTYLGQDEIVAEIYSEKAETRTILGNIKAGIDTAEWAYDRADVLAVIKHNRPEISRTWNVEEKDGSTYQGHAFRGLKLFANPVKITTLAITNVTDQEYEIPITVSKIRLSLASNEEMIQEPYHIEIKDRIEISAANPEERFLIRNMNHYSGIIIDSFMENSTNVEQGKTIGQIMIIGKDKVSTLWLIRAGVDTAEWSIDRPDMIGRVKHSHAAYSMSTRRSQEKINFLAHEYRSKWNWDPAFQVTEVVVKNLLDENEYPNTRWICSGLLLY